MKPDHLVHLQDVIKSVELIAGKKLDEREKNLFIGFLRNTYGQGYQRAANIAADVVYNEKFKLSSEHFNWFMLVHRQHMQAFGTENQKKYSLPNILDVKYDKQEDCLKVYYKDIWWHYDRRGHWY
ncbi:hypothetical protein RCG19_15900 [Neobacillus sp. OS1-2]|uniref:hypothetical protein n=1 Tax=Neobacillus sp. OS1-2 TaxID=3070680 RepID=UPI0027E0D702|nr:hypothetical protein [Neobacillus sp. OS1-2]WML38671.1 hypothetical protein RCG19_15900 [Neobacillus sp. OS1-2]